MSFQIFYLYRMIKKDELIGAWYSGADENSTYHNMVQGFGVEFKTDGTGILHHWNEDAEDLDNTSTEKPIQWQRIGDKTIKIKTENKDWETISYQTELFEGVRNMFYYKINNTNTDSFWNFVEPVYKVTKPPMTRLQKIAIVLMILMAIAYLVIMLK